MKQFISQKNIHWCLYNITQGETVEWDDVLMWSDVAYVQVWASICRSTLWCVATSTSCHWDTFFFFFFFDANGKNLSDWIVRNNKDTCLFVYIGIYNSGWFDFILDAKFFMGFVKKHKAHSDQTGC